MQESVDALSPGPASPLSRAPRPPRTPLPGPSCPTHNHTAAPAQAHQPTQAAAGRVPGQSRESAGEARATPPAHRHSMAGPSIAAPETLPGAELHRPAGAECSAAPADALGDAGDPCRMGEEALGRTIESVCRALAEHGLHPIPVARGSSGTYFCRDAGGRIVGVFKPQVRPLGRGSAGLSLTHAASDEPYPSPRHAPQPATKRGRTRSRTPS
jgi:hypothetical protein